MIINIAKHMNELRIVPRMMMLAYMFLLLDSSYWYMHLLAPSTQQASFVAAILAAGAGWFTIYVNSGGNK